MTLTREEVERWAPEHGHGDPLRSAVLALLNERDALRAERDAAAADRRKETAHIERCELEIHNHGHSIDGGLFEAVSTVCVALEVAQAELARARADAARLRKLLEVAPDWSTSHERFSAWRREVADALAATDSAQWLSDKLAAAVLPWQLAVHAEAREHHRDANPPSTVRPEQVKNVVEDVRADERAKALADALSAVNTGGPYSPGHVYAEIRNVLEALTPRPAEPALHRTDCRTCGHGYDAHSDGREAAPCLKTSCDCADYCPKPAEAARVLPVDDEDEYRGIDAGLARERDKAQKDLRDTLRDLAIADWGRVTSQAQCVALRAALGHALTCRDCAEGSGCDYVLATLNAPADDTALREFGLRVIEAMRKRILNDEPIDSCREEIVAAVLGDGGR